MRRKTKMEKNTKVIVKEIPQCQFCGESAKVDGMTKMGCWAFMCKNCFKLYGVGLGLGKGQEMIKGEQW